MADQLRPEDPRRMGPYRLTGRLGSGGMGEVYLGRSAGGRQVAVKVIRPELASDENFRARFRREVAAARRVNGLYTAPVAEADTEGAVPWLATAYVPGPSLQAAVARHGPLPARSVLALAAGLAEALGAVHAAGLVHRDVKPSNVLLDRDGPRLIDFGIVWDAESAPLTVIGAIFGSPFYISPEYAEGEEFGPPADVFSLGAVLTYAAAGRPPFTGDSQDTIVNRIVHGAPDLSGAPAEVRPVIEWCLAKDPAARPTPAQLLAELGGALLLDPWLPARFLADIPADQPRPNPDPDTQTIERPAAAQRTTATPSAPHPTTDVSAVPPPGTLAPATPQPDTAVPAASVAPTNPPAATDLPPSTAPTPTPPAHAPAPSSPAGPGMTQPEADSSRRPGRPAARAIAAIAIPALAVVAVAAVGAGLWLALGHHGGGATSSSTSSSTATGTATATSPGPTPKPASPSPFRFSLAGAVERACSTALHSVSGGRPASIVIADQTAATIRVIWLTYLGRQSPAASLKPGASGKILRGYVGDAWQLDGPHGCAGEFIITAAAARIVAEKA